MEKIKENLEYIGEDGQFQIVKSFVEDRENKLSKVYKCVDQNAFTIPALRVIVGLIKERLSKHPLVPTYNELEIMLREKARTEIEREEYEATIEKLKKTPKEGFETPVESAMRFFTQQELLKLSNLIKDDIIKGNIKQSRFEYYQNKLMTINGGLIENEPYSPFKAFDATVNGPEEIVIPTGIAELDEVFKGGIQKGELGMIIGGTGGGKTTLNIILALNAVLKGYKVLYVNFEDVPQSIHKKFYSAVTHQPTWVFNNPTLSSPYRDMILEIEKEFEDKLQVLLMDSSECTLEDIQQIVRDKKNMTGWSPDLILIDYLDCLKKTTNSTMKDWDATERCMRKMSNWARSEEMAIWVSQQFNRAGNKKDNRDDGMSNIQGGFKAIQPCAYVILLHRNRDEMENNTGQLEVSKNRRGPLKLWENIYFNNGTHELNLSGINPNVAFNNNFNTKDFEYENVPF